MRQHNKGDELEPHVDVLLGSVGDQIWCTNYPARILCISLMAQMLKTIYRPEFLEDNLDKINELDIRFVK